MRLKVPILQSAGRYESMMANTTGRITLKIETLGFSECGPHRTTNQDRYMLAPSHTVLADGMGGLPHGAAAAECICDVLINRTSTIQTLSGTGRNQLSEIFNQTNDYLRANFPDSGTTACVTGIFVDGFYVASVGDTRAYLFRDGKYHQLTTDHNVAATSGSAFDANLLTNYFGKRGLGDISYQAGAVLDNDIFISLSDGAYGVGVEYIFSDFSPTSDILSSCENIRTRIGGKIPHDNYTVTIARVREDD